MSEVPLYRMVRVHTLILAALAGQNYLNQATVEVIAGFWCGSVCVCVRVHDLIPAALAGHG